MFKNRVAAGKELSKKVKEKLSDKRDLIVIALPRGGIPVAKEIAKELNCPMDILAVKKIGHPSNPEYAAGAVAEDGEYYYNPRADVDKSTLEKLKQNALSKAQKQASQLRGDRAAVALKGMNIILVDDGIATGSTIEAAIKLIKKKGAKSIFLAVPVGPSSTVKKLGLQVDNMVCLETPTDFWAVGQWYSEFPQVSDQEAKSLLESTESAFEESTI